MWAALEELNEQSIMVFCSIKRSKKNSALINILIIRRLDPPATADEIQQLIDQVAARQLEVP